MINLHDSTIPTTHPLARYVNPSLNAPSACVPSQKAGYQLRSETRGSMSTVIFDLLKRDERSLL
jgi:hypothetical protein